ncbi:hypothetical protein GLOIN_2v1768689 [Rhizophagus irregularis DAOM 181602=DAOM 197198]|nr:hypothetical protein GLOIN_2v1768689 [Rhizophagus irregularis DAOM 181602=DAOM 197198]
MVHDTFNTNILPLDVNISRSMEKVPTADNTVFYLQIVNALQDVFQKEINEKLNIMLEKVDQLITPEDSYWKNLASKTCKVQLPLLGLYSDDLEFKKGFEIEQILTQFKNLKDLIKQKKLSIVYLKLMMTKLYICHSDTKKGMGKKTTTVMGTTFTLAVCEIVLNPRHPKISVSDNALHRRFNEYLQNSKEIIADITKDISREELGDSYVSSGNNDTGSEGDVHSDKNIINQDESDKEQYENDGNIDQ